VLMGKRTWDNRNFSMYGLGSVEGMEGDGKDTQPATNGSRADEFRMGERHTLCVAPPLRAPGVRGGALGQLFSFLYIGSARLVFLPPPTLAFCPTCKLDYP
jgi:hypothetical protein